jgi:hypothetical protein
LISILMRIAISVPADVRSSAPNKRFSSQVLAAAPMLSGASGRLKSEVSKFLTNVRAAWLGL